MKKLLITDRSRALVQSSCKHASCKHVRVINTPLHPSFYYSKIGVYRGIHNFLIFALKDRLWVITCTHSLSGGGGGATSKKF